jgi:protein-S-isoprenylcysteine O-methyltransferase Ste14
MALQEEFEKQGNILFIYRSYFPLIILLVGMILFIQKELNPEMFILSNTPYEILYEIGALIIGLLGLAVRIYTVGHTPKNTSGRNTKEGQVADTLNTTGIYSVVRHPLYLGNFLMWLSPAMLTGNFWFIIVHIVVLLI